MKTDPNITLQTIVILLSSLLWACNREPSGIRVAQKPLTEAVYASGFVVAKEEYEIISQVEGYVSSKLVEDGHEVAKGDPLYIIDSEQQSARNRIARETYELAAKNHGDDSPVLAELKALVQTAQTRMKHDSANFTRFSNLMKENATTRAEFDRMKLAFESSTDEYILQKSRYERTKNQLLVDLQNARNNLIITSDEAGKYIVRSQVNGRVFMTTKDNGELIRRNELIAVVGKNDAYYIQLNVDELDVQRVKAGQEVLVKIDAYAGKVFRASVSKVYPMIDRKQQSVRVDAELQESLPGFFSGLALEANIIIRKKDKAIVVPKNALLPGDSVLIHTGDGEKKVKVTPGIETLDEIEIVDGLDTSHLIVMSENK
ncbi:MAG TPA: efflux RND transporter periplasmic adaptor subunit [Chryseosolibacter sp.]|nr:efflux RND transporter periplasmic adaptor subunit [Chryseosolibacter sp.]